MERSKCTLRWTCVPRCACRWACATPGPSRLRAPLPASAAFEPPSEALRRSDSIEIVGLRKVYGSGSKAAGHSVLAHVQDLMIDSVSSGTFTTLIQGYARRRLQAPEREDGESDADFTVRQHRRLGMSDATADSVSVDT